MPTTSFDSLPNDARIWVYAADRALTDAEVDRIEHDLQAFTTDWTSHGAALRAAASVFDHRFVVIALDTEESSASGCSIDKSLRAVQQLEQGLQLSLTNRLFVWVVGPNGWEKWSVGSAKKSLGKQAVAGRNLLGGHHGQHQGRVVGFAKGASGKQLVGQSALRRLFPFPGC